LLVEGTCKAVQARPRVYFLSPEEVSARTTSGVVIEPAGFFHSILLQLLAKVLAGGQGGEKSPNNVRNHYLWVQLTL